MPFSLGQSRRTAFHSARFKLGHAIEEVSSLGNAPAQRVLVDRDDGARLCFFIPPGVAPATGDTIQWGPHHASWAGHRTRKLTHEIDPDAPLR